eukprot:TRINITY_DN96134_c0_g1_i1.p1 TRINITY_DN96134_c0_g1~~TRINITY_DN96134_c0_g1_i1.p1  ORF type:complete len:492 (-),score=120.24 TRINITY_DN96134_c0_g1_i1:43-1518(-)
MDKTPWWAIGTLCLLATSRMSDQSVSDQFRGLAGKQGTRRLEGTEEGKEASKEGSEEYTPPFKVNVENKTLTVSLPCWAVKPCGEVTVPPQGLEVTDVFGWYHYVIPGFDSIKPQYGYFQHAFSQYTAFFVVGLAVLKFIMQISTAKKRQQLMAKAKQIYDGVVDDDDDDEDEESKLSAEELKKAQMDPNSDQFVAKGNIYRVMAVVSPRRLGFAKWFRLAAQAFVCAYMQLYLPYSIFMQVFSEWRLDGVKSPLWFASNAFHFTTKVAALASVCKVFQAKCEASIREGAQAANYIFTHAEPENPKVESSSKKAVAVVEEKPPPEEGLKRRLLDEVDSMKESLVDDVVTKYDDEFDYLHEINERFWCLMSMCMNVVMSLALQVCMFIKVATFTGDTINVALVAVSLYFVFDLDNKALDTDPKLKAMYRRAVLEQTVEVEPGGSLRILQSTASAAIAISRLAVPLGLAGIVLLAWQNTDTGFVIGGSGLETE